MCVRADRGLGEPARQRGEPGELAGRGIRLRPYANSGGALEFDTGAFGAGDGEAFNVAGNVGLPLGATGFANLSLEYGSSNPTNRSAPRGDAIALLAAGNTHVVSDTPQVWGSPSIDDDLKLFGNFGYTTAAGVQVYAHTNYASKTVTGGFFFRNPNTRGGVFSPDGGQRLLVVGVQPPRPPARRCYANSPAAASGSSRRLTRRSGCRHRSQCRSPQSGSGIGVPAGVGLPAHRTHSTRSVRAS